MTVRDSAAARRLRHALAARLALSGAISSREWRTAFETVPRHAFIDRLVRRRHVSDERDVIGPDQPDWLPRIYADAALTGYDPNGKASPTLAQPSVTARILDALNLHPDHQILEVGTGTGYVTALLCQIADPAQVISVDTNPEVVDHARAVLAALDLYPVIATADGPAGLPSHAPFDRILGGSAIARVPASWLAQTRPGGRIVATLGHATVALVRQPDGSASGPFLPEIDHVTDNRHSNVGGHTAVEDAIEAISQWPDRTGTFDDLPDFIDPSVWFLARLQRPGLNYVSLSDAQGVSACLLDPVTGGWSRALTVRGTGQRILTETGPYRLWDDVNAMYQAWAAAGKPAPDRMGLSVEPDGTHVVWADTGSGRVALAELDRTR